MEVDFVDVAFLKIQRNGKSQDVHAPLFEEALRVVQDRFPLPKDCGWLLQA